ncbi:dihydroorotate dehydrogenase [Aminivibrio sp.]|jgi:dihydroorotate dehydrogenase subfamily 1|uniref:dihydroorotate dehydrogenase n=1 Tax=Aminivibrio sp. TaxID=1872489 RepID=UPI001D2A153E|nr:diguanylate cyclase [Synergistaceae bacterium]MDD4021261.1 diguanylate cyclase [Synergistaceae bacterium]MDD4612015.1 diguanylate cyclase [Synergistaceae bacterium]NCC58502.1 diguanylate cyclase [Synergistales bacterium]
MATISSTVNGVYFSNPVLTAAGPNVGSPARLREAILGGAGGIVTKTVSVMPAKDPRPTIRKSSCGGLLNCETWSELPVESYLESYREIKRAGVPLVTSIGYTPDDVRNLGKLLEREVKPDIFEFSTHYTGKSIEPLVSVAKALRETVSVPIWMKISPATPDIEELAVRASEFVDGFVAINSLGPALDFDIESAKPALGSSYGQGWLSGPPILPVALRIVYQIASVQTRPVIGVGGISCGEDALKFIMAGASLVQICSAAVRHGSEIYGRVAAEMGEWLDSRGIDSIEDVRGRYISAVRGRDGNIIDG